MPKNKKTKASLAKPFVVGVVGLLAWTLSIQVVPVRLNPNKNHTFPCHARDSSGHIFQSMRDGIVTDMYNDGIVLSIRISSSWQALSDASRKHLYDSFRCFAQHEKVAFHVLPSQGSVP